MGKNKQKNTLQEQGMEKPPFYWQLSVVPKYHGNLKSSKINLTIDETISYYKVQNNQLNNKAVLSAHMR